MRGPARVPLSLEGKLALFFRCTGWGGHEGQRVGCGVGIDPAADLVVIVGRQPIPADVLSDG